MREPDRGGEACAKTFIQSFGAKAYRRALSDDETAGSGPMAYHVGADGYTYADGIDLVTRVLLQSAGFLYTPRFGAPGVGGRTVHDDPDEIATSLSYLLTAGPPDATLLGHRRRGCARHRRRARNGGDGGCLRRRGSRRGLVRVVREWLGIDDVARREKAQGVYPDFANLSTAMEKESRAFIDEVLNKSTGTR